MIAKRTELGNDSVSNFRRRFNHLRRELDCLGDLTRMAVDVPRSKPASYKRNDSPHTEHRLRPKCRQNGLQSLT